MTKTYSEMFWSSISVLDPKNFKVESFEDLGSLWGIILLAVIDSLKSNSNL